MTLRNLLTLTHRGRHHKQIVQSRKYLQVSEKTMQIVLLFLNARCAIVSYPVFISTIKKEQGRMLEFVVRQSG